jgi:hypothetical protein
VKSEEQITRVLEEFRMGTGKARRPESSNQHGGEDAIQWQWQPPPQQCPPPLPDAGAPAGPALAEANVDIFLDNFFEPQCGHSAPFQPDERTRISLSSPHFSQ